MPQRAVGFAMGRWRRQGTSVTAASLFARSSVTCSSDGGGLSGGQNLALNSSMMRSPWQSSVGWQWQASRKARQRAQARFPPGVPSKAGGG